MTDDYLVKERSNNDCIGLAKQARAWFGQGDAQYLDICECLMNDKVWTVNGLRGLILQIKPDDEMGNVDASTIYVDGTATITTKQSCWDGARRKQNRPRQTLAHELGHVVQGHVELRANTPMARRQGAAGKYISSKNRPSTIRSAEGLPASKSAEHQAKVFAPAFLINDKVAEKLSSAKEIALAFGISQQSAEIYFDQLTKRRDRKKSGERVRQMADEAIAILSKRRAPPPRPNYLNAPCPSCGLNTLVQIDSKGRCMNSYCGFFGDLFQDGDKATLE